MKTCRQIELTIEIVAADGQWAARCVELGTATCGETYREAEKNIQEAIAADLNGLEEAGIVEKFFKERGIKVTEIKLARRPKKILFNETSYRSEATYSLALCT